MIKKKMMLEGTMMITYQPIGERVNFFRMVLLNADNTTGDMDYVVDEVERLGRDIVL